MSYHLLRGLYYGETSNADLATAETRERLHIASELDDLVPHLLNAGTDVILTGNPGDGKSHIVAHLKDQGQISNAEVELDLSAKPTSTVVEHWQSARSARRPFIMCANEGPLLEFTAEASRCETLRHCIEDINNQLGRLTLTSHDEMPSMPRHAALIDLADRNVLDEKIIVAALTKICARDFLPNIGPRVFDSSAGRNLILFQESEDTRYRLARLLRLAAQRVQDHVTFRQLWSCISYAICAGKAENTLKVELSRGEVGLRTYPIDYVCSARAEGSLLDAARTHADPALFAAPDIDDQIWTRGAPRHGDWLVEDPEFEPPALRWADGDHASALRDFKSLKRLVTLAHEEGERILTAMESATNAPGDFTDEALRADVVAGIRHSYLSADQERLLPSWLCVGVPLWIPVSYRDMPLSARPHVAVTSINETDFDTLRPIRAPWLSSVLGPLPEVAWLEHRDSGLRLKIDANLLAVLRQASLTSGAQEPPERISRFLSLLAGWSESRESLSLGGDRFAVIDAPRRELVAAGSVHELDGGGASYGS